MTNLLCAARRVLRALGYLELSLAILILVGLLATIGSQVFSRYVLGQPLIWVEEMASYMLIWLGFTAAALAHKQGRHIKIAMLSGIRSPAFQLWLVIFAEGVALAFCLIVLGHLRKPMMIEARATSIGLPIDIPKHWFFSVPLAFGLTSITLTSLYNLLGALRSLPDGAPPEPLLGKFGDHEEVDADEIERALEVGNIR